MANEVLLRGTFGHLRILLWRPDKDEVASSILASPTAVTSTTTLVSPQVFVCDLRHYFDLPMHVPSPARRMAEHLTFMMTSAAPSVHDGRCVPVPTS